MAMQTERIYQQQEQPSIEPTSSAKPPWLLIVLSLVAVLPFWTVRYPVVTDYPNHLGRWFVLFHMKDRAYHFADFYAPAWGPLPYISPDILAMVLQYFLPIDVVGRCILSLCILLVVFATYFFLKKACPENVELASFGILVAFNPNFLMGSISNQFSLAFCLLVVSLWVSYCKAPKANTAAGIVIGLIIVYLSHLIGFVVAGTVMGVYALFQEQLWKKVGILAFLSLPALLLFASNLGGHGGSDSSFVYISGWYKLRNLFFPMRLYTNILDLILLAGLAFLIFLVFKSRQDVTSQRVWLTVCVILLLAYLVTPAKYGFGDYVDLRFMPFLYLFLLAAWRFHRVPRYLYIGLAVLVLFRVASVEQMFIARQPGLKQLTASFEAIPRDARVLQILRVSGVRLVGSGDIHHLEYGLIQRGFLVPTLFHLSGVHPIRLTGSTYCLDAFCSIYYTAPVDWQQIANTYDYLWVHTYPEMNTYVSQIGDVVFSNDAVTVYRVRHSRLQ